MIRCRMCGKPAKLKIEYERTFYFCSPQCGVNEMNKVLKSKIKKEDIMSLFDKLKDYSPEKVTDNFSPIKGKYDCAINSARVELYEGEYEGLKGHTQFKYELVILDGQPNAGKRLWKSVDLDNPDEDKKGKTAIEKLADTMFTVGLTFKTQEELEALLETFVEMKVKISCGYFYKDEDKDELGNPREDADAIQWHKIIGISDSKATADGSIIPF